MGEILMWSLAVFVVLAGPMLLVPLADIRRRWPRGRAWTRQRPRA
jgi:hypothetical protein